MKIFNSKLIIFTHVIFLTMITVTCKKIKTVDLRGNKESADDSNDLAVFPTSFFKPVDGNSEGPDVCTNKIDADQNKAPPDKRLSDTYLSNCSGCHGTAGEGHANFPQVRTASKERIVQIVRAGGAQMPAFPEDVIGNDDLDKLASALSGSDKFDPFSTQVNISTPWTEITDDYYSAIMKKGLVGWRTPGERGACVSCHGPDGIDLARINYPSSAILRRALGQGLSSEKSINIVRMINAQRLRYFIKSPCISASFIPFQPGDQILAGASNEERDRKLSDTLKSKDANLTQTISSLGDAKNLISKISSLDVSSIPIAVRLNHWTEDSFHGDSHKSTAEWLPEIPLEAKSTDDLKKWLDLQNNYLKDPSDENFWAMLDQVDSLDGHRFITTGGVSERIAREKYRSVLMMQHMMRFNKRKFPDLTKTKNVDRFSVWETAQISNVMARGCADSGTDSDPYPCWKYPESFYKKMGTNRSELLNDVLKIDLPWLIAGWMIDPALQLTENGDAQMTHLHAAFEKHLTTFDSTAGKFAQLPFHQIYISFTRLVKSIEALNDHWPNGSSHKETAINSCWANIGSGIDQWIKQTLPVIDNEIASTSPAINSTHKDLITSAVSSIHRSILFKIKDAKQNPKTECSKIKDRDGVLNVKDSATKIKQWQDNAKISDEVIDKLVIDLSQ